MSNRRWTFGPGSLESVTLYRRTVRDGAWEYRIRGSFTVYCGNGWDHTADVTSSDWYSVTADPFDTYNVAHELVNLALEDWSDPCEVPQDTDAIAAMRLDDGTLPAFAWPGGYQMLYWTADGAEVCPKCANKTDTSDPVTDGGIYWEGPDLECADCGDPIPSAYGDPDAQD